MPGNFVQKMLRNGKIHRGDPFVIVLQISSYLVSKLRQRRQLGKGLTLKRLSCQQYL